MTTVELNPTTFGSNADRAKLFAKMAKVAGLVGHVQKNGYNDFHKYAYVTEADLVDAVRKVLSENGVAFFISADRYEVRPAADGKSGDITTVFVTAAFACADTGATYSVSWMGTGADKSDKGMYKAYTGAVKYLLMKTFQISTNDDPEQVTKAGAEEAKRSARKAEADKPAPVPAKEETLASIAKVIRQIELVDDVAGASAQATFEQNREKIVASAKLADATLTKLAVRLVEVTERKASTAQAAAREAAIVTHSAPAMEAAGVLAATDDEDLPFTPDASDKATPVQLDAIRKGLADLKAVDAVRAKGLADYVRSGHTTSGYTTYGAALHVLASIRETLGTSVTLAA